MKKVILFCFFSFVLLYSCNNKSAENNPSQQITTNVTDSDGIIEQQPEVRTIEPPYPQEIWGIWGDISYLRDLKKYNSIGKSVEHIKFDVDLKISKDLILAMRPSYGEAAVFDTTKFEIIAAGKDSLYIRSKNSGKKQLFLKLLPLPSNNFDDWDINEEKYSAIALLEWFWFQGEYTLTNSKGKSYPVSFFKDGTVKGFDYRNFIFGIDVDGKDYISFFNEDEDYSKFMLIEYGVEEKAFYCYNIEDFDDWEYPFIKKSLAFKLQKKE